MSELITGKEAKLAWANGDVVEYYEESRDAWFEIRGNTFVSVFDNRDKFRLKPRTILINNIEVPAPFEPKNSESAWVVDSATPLGYRNIFHHGGCVHFMCWRTEEEIKKVVGVLRKLLNP